MPLNIRGQLTNEPRIRAGFIGCGSHAFRNVYPTFQFAPVELVATCDLVPERAAAFARQFGATASYTDHREMLKRDDLDAVFIVTNYDHAGRPRFVELASDCLAAGKHVWMEKPPAASVSEIERLQSLAGPLNVMVGFKKMFFPANEKAYELIHAESFGGVSMAMLNYPQSIPSKAEFSAYFGGKRVDSVVNFLDHLCHPASLLIYLMGMPTTLHYQRAPSGAGLAMFTYADGRIASLALTHGQSYNGGMERTVIVSAKRGHLVVENNTTVTLHRDIDHGYGDQTNFYTAAPNETSAVWQPEFSLGQLYNKGIFLLGYFGEVNEFARSIIEKRPPTKCHLRHAWQVTRIFEAFGKGEGMTQVI